MKYLLLIYTHAARWEHPVYLRDPAFLALPEDERDELSRQVAELHEEIVASGEFVVGSALADPLTTTTLRGRDGVPVATDGPFIEAKEQLAGYIVVDCASPERAAEIARRIPDARFAAVEVRPITDSTGPEM